ncbi:MAG TPA: S4 domain-containing protein [bacterium]|nr:S4 domain-containing protein [bacterium]
MNLLPTAFPEDLEFREEFTQTLLSHDFSKGPLFTRFLSPWEESLLRAELLLHRRPFHVEAWGGYPQARRRLIAIHPFHPIDPARFPLAAFVAGPAQTFATVGREQVLLALMAGVDGGPPLLPAEIGDVNAMEGGWAGVVARTLPPVGVQGEVRFAEADLALLWSNPGKPLAVRDGGSLATPRLDAVAAIAHKPSREQFKRLVENGGALVNYKPITKGSVQVQTGDIISLRGFPTFRIAELGGGSKKGRLWVKLELAD